MHNIFTLAHAKQFLKRSTDIKLLKDKDNKPVQDKKGIADLLQEQYMSVFSDPNNPAKVDSSFSPATAAMSDDDMTFTKEDVIEAIDEVNPNAARGPDEIPIRVLKECKLTVAEPIYLIWDCSFTKSQVPSYYKDSIVTPIHKKGSKFLAQNYRPVSLTSHIVKLFERILRKQLVNYLERNNLISKTARFSQGTQLPVRTSRTPG